MLPTRRRLVISLALVCLLAAHVATRFEAIRQIPLNKRHFWSESFRYSLAALAGHGLKPFSFAGVPESIPLQDFLGLRKATLSTADFEAFFNLPDSVPVEPPVGIADISDEHLAWPVYTTRVLELWSTTILWRIFGIRWDVVFGMYVVLSTLGCLAVFLIGRGLSGSGWLGLMAALFHSIAPLEASYSVYSPRDISPLWFAGPPWAVLICLVGRSPGWWRNLAACGLTGALAALGLGWRHDAMVTVLAMVGLTGPLLLLAGRGWRLAASGVITCAAAAWMVKAAIAWGCPVVPQASGVGFHMACYAEETRCNLFHLENSQGISRDDLQVITRVAQRRSEEGLPPIPFDPSHCHELYGPDHARISRELFLESFLPNMRHWLASAPSFLWMALQATRVEGLPLASMGHGPRLGPEMSRGLLRWWLRLQVWLAAAMPPLALLCLLRLLFGMPGRLARDAWILRGLGLFALGYVALLFLVLPEQKHAGLLVLPQAVLAAEFLAFLASLFNPLTMAVLASGFTARRFGLYASAAMVLAIFWTGLLAWSTRLGRAYRLDQVEQVMELAERADWQENLGHKRIQEWNRSRADCFKPVAILAWIQAEESGVRLACREGTHQDPQPLIQYHDGPSKLFTTWHRLPEGDPCYFVVTLPGQGAMGDPRPDVVRLEVLGKGKILSTARLELGGDSGPVPWLRTVVSPEENQPGSPLLRSFSMSGLTVHRPLLYNMYLGLELDEQARFDGIRFRANPMEKDPDEPADSP